MMQPKRKINMGKHGRELFCLVMSVLLCRVRVGDSCAPFGLALMAAGAIAGIDPIFAGLGVCIGAFLSGPPLWGVIMGAALFVLCLRLLKLLSSPLGATGKMALFVLTEAAVLPFESGGGWSSVAYGLLSVGLGACAVLLMVRGLKLIGCLGRLGTLQDGEQLLLSALLGLGLLGLGDVQGAGVGLTEILLVFSALTLAWGRGVSALGPAVVLGTIASLGGGGVMLAGVTALCALCATLGAAHGRAYAAGSYLAAYGMLMLLFPPEGVWAALAEAALGSVLFLAMPESWMKLLRTLLDSRLYGERNSRLATERMRQRTALELEETAKLCAQLASLFQEAGETTQVVQSWPLGAARRVCSGCESRALCCRDEAAFDKTMLVLLKAYDRGDPVQPLSPMDSHCRFFREIMSVAYQSYNQAVAHEAGLRRAAEQQAYMNRQLCGVSAMLSLMAGRLREEPWGDGRLEGELMPYLVRRGFNPLSLDASYPAGRLNLLVELSTGDRRQAKALVGAVEKKLRRGMRMVALEPEENGRWRLELEDKTGLCARMACASLPEAEAQISGDETGELHMSSGRVVYAVSDGMGSGEEANRESRAAIGLLFDQFRLGMERELIYENVNRLLLARGEKEIYATLDAASIDLLTGEAEVVKFGAPPTCLVRAGNVRFLTGDALPCGIIDEARPSVRRIRLKRRDRLVFCTDGVYDLLGRELEAALKQTLTASPKGMAEALLEAASQKGRPDDMTVMVVEVA